MIISGPPIPVSELHAKLIEAKPAKTALERKRDKLMTEILRQQEALLKQVDAQR